MTTNKIATIETLSSIAERNSDLQFVHLCTAALKGERWAVTRMLDVLDMVDGLSPQGVLEVIRKTNTTRPDGAIARSLVEP